jgi:hypothetical protein
MQHIIVNEVYKAKKQRACQNREDEASCPSSTVHKAMRFIRWQRVLEISPEGSRRQVQLLKMS